MNKEIKEDLANVGVVFLLTSLGVAFLTLCVFVPIVGKVVFSLLGIAFILWLIWSAIYTIKHKIF